MKDRSTVSVEDRLLVMVMMVAGGTVVVIGVVSVGALAYALGGLMSLVVGLGVGGAVAALWHVSPTVFRWLDRVDD